VAIAAWPSVLVMRQNSEFPWINKFFAMCFELPQRAFFVNAHQPAIAGYVSSKNRRKPAVYPLFGHSSSPNVAKRSIGRTRPSLAALAT